MDGKRFRNATVGIIDAVVGKYVFKHSYSYL